MKQVDVFTDRPLTGNPLAVFFDGAGLSSEEMLAIAREMNLSETTFVLPPTEQEADYKVRIFTPAKEIPFAGHPSIGTAHALIEDGRIPLKKTVTTVRQEVGIGVLPIQIQLTSRKRRLITMTQGKPRLGQIVEDIEGVADILSPQRRDRIYRLAYPSFLDRPRSIDGTNPVSRANTKPLAKLRETERT
jgi:PhzF family phenazine biosynthesis protein